VDGGQTVKTHLGEVRQKGKPRDRSHRRTRTRGRIENFSEEGKPASRVYSQIGTAKGGGRAYLLFKNSTRIGGSGKFPVKAAWEGGGGRKQDKMDIQTRTTTSATQRPDLSTPAAGSPRTNEAGWLTKARVRSREARKEKDRKKTIKTLRKKGRSPPQAISVSKHSVELLRAVLPLKVDIGVRKVSETSRGIA